MWVRWPLPMLNIKGGYYKQDDSSEGLKELLWIICNKVIEEECLILRFSSNELAKQFYRNFLELSTASSTNTNMAEAGTDYSTYIGSVNTNMFEDGIDYANYMASFKRGENSLESDIMVYFPQNAPKNLKELLRIALENSYLVSQDIMLMIKYSEYNSVLEGQFYEQLPKLTEENFVELFNMAAQLTHQNDISVNSSETLWELAIKCKDIFLLDQWEETLKAIPKNNKFYSLSREELSYFYLSKFGEEETTEAQSIDLILKILEIGLGRFFCEVKNQEIIKKSMLSFLKINWQEQSKIFISLTNSETLEETFDAIVLDLLVYIKSLLLGYVDIKEGSITLLQEQERAPIVLLKEKLNSMHNEGSEEIDFLSAIGEFLEKSSDELLAKIFTTEAISEESNENDWSILKDLLIYAKSLQQQLELKPIDSSSNSSNSRPRPSF
jgi:hypothetical protein